MKKQIIILLFALFPLLGIAQINTQRLLDIGRNALYFEDYIVAIQYFNQVIKVKPHLPEPYFYRAFAKLNLEDYRGAIRDCDAALNINPFLPKVYYCKGYAYRMIGDYEASTENFKKSLEFEPNNINTTSLWIENLIRTEAYDEALVVADSLIQEYPRYTEAYLLRSQILLQKADTLQAQANLDTAINYNDRSDLAYAMRGMMRYELKEYETAEEDLNEAIRLESYRADYYGNRAIIRMQRNNLRGAMADFDTSIEIDNKNALSYFNRGLLRANVGDDNRAVDDFSTCLALDPNNYSAYFQRAVLNTQLGSYKDAITDFTTVLNRYPDFIPAYYGRAEAKRKNRDRAGAERDKYTAMRIEDDVRSGKMPPKSSGQEQLELSAKGQAILHQLNQKENDRYQSEIRGQVQYKDIDIEPLSNFMIGLRNPQQEVHNFTLYNAQLAHYNEANHVELAFCTSLKAQQFTDLQAFFDIIEKSTRSLKRDSLNEMALMQRAYALTQVGDFPSAIADFDLIIRYYPQNVLAYFNRANARIQEASNNPQYDPLSAEYTLAISDFQMALQLDPRLAYAQYNIGYIYLLQKNYQKALASFTVCIQDYPDFAEAYYNRALIFLYQGKKEKGRADLSKAGELGIYSAYNIIRRYAY